MTAPKTHSESTPQEAPKKILVLQLARLGDLYQTWPVLRALRRLYPEADLHVLARRRYAEVLREGDVIDQVWTLESRGLLEPLVDEKPQFDTSLERLTAFTNELIAEDFDRIINLSFSPVSSYLTREITNEGAQVSGYTRFADGYLSLPDDGSAYFYAQVGVGRPNRVHITDLFAHVAGVELIEADWNALTAKTSARISKEQPKDDYVVLHVGASDPKKTLSWSKWLQVTKLMLERWHGELVLVGAADERAWAEQIAATSSPRRAINLVGRTSIPELEALVEGARLVIGADSAPMQIATLADTPALNISLPTVSFWETGPRSAGSRIVFAESELDISAEEIVGEALAILDDRGTSRATIRVPGRTYPYLETRPHGRGFEWHLLRAMYMGEMFPAPPSSLFSLAAQRLLELNVLALEQIEAVQKNSANSTARAILDQVDLLLQRIEAEVPETGPLIRWFTTERVRIAPLSLPEVIAKTRSVHEQFGTVLALYTESGSKTEVGSEDQTAEVHGDDHDLG